MSEKQNNNQETGKRYTLQYRQKKLYAIVTDTSLTLSMSDHDVDDFTLSGLDTVAGLVGLCLDAGVDREKIAGVVWEASRVKSDLPAQLSKILVDDGGKL